ncbi:lytic polysaccharide monooxygenase [Streptomyces sp. NPDC097619]|uniref:lytic polysaccharide monooxygenase auxiliary activity family 9 protein n=1 Tax=Streptomyces sp. NPDC097619 TaxID=3157228 RepID=UPI003320315D
MRLFRMPKPPGRRATAAGVGLGVLVGAGIAMAPTAQSHGYIDQPISRSKLCQTKAVSDCGPIQWEPQSVEGFKGFPAAGPADGKICAGGHSEFAQLDDPRGGNWPATQVYANQSYNFRWQFTANHSTTDFRYYITKNGWDSTKPLTRAALEPAPFFTVAYNGARPAMTTVHQGVMPSGKAGKHMILAVWTVNDTPMAFYSCSDVQF